MRTDTVASHATLEALRLLDPGPDVFVIITPLSLTYILDFLISQGRIDGLGRGWRA